MPMSSSNIFVATVLLIFIASAQAIGAITYQIAPREGAVASWSLLGGSITTDGTLGSISPLNFESWNFTFSSPAGESKITTNNGSALQISQTFNSFYLPLPQTAPLLNATREQLTLIPGVGSLDLFFSTQDIFSEDFTGKAISFGVGYTGVAGRLTDNTVDPSDIDRPLYIDPAKIVGLSDNANHAALASYPSGPIVFASLVVVPEPSGCLLFLTGLSAYYCVAPRVRAA